MSESELIAAGRTFIYLMLAVAVFLNIIVAVGFWCVVEKKEPMRKGFWLALWLVGIIFIVYATAVSRDSLGWVDMLGSCLVGPLYYTFLLGLFAYDKEAS